MPQNKNAFSTRDSLESKCLEKNECAAKYDQFISLTTRYLL